jgi:hypothetical protein
VKGAQLLV